MDKQKIFERLPAFIKPYAVSAWGTYLRCWRYGPETELLVQEALQRDAWTREQWATWQQQRLAYILHHAATTVPYYRDQWQQRRKQGDRSSWELLQNWPILDKAEVREKPKQFISESAVGKRLYIDHTGGTTGKPTLIYQSQKVTRHWFAIHEARVRRWNGLNYHDRWGIFGGQKVVPLGQRHPPYWVYNRGLHQVYFSIFHITPLTAKDYVAALWRYKPKYLIVYPSELYILAKQILQQQLSPPHLGIIISNSEALTASYRSTIQQAFDCQIIDTYGMAEIASAASECNHGNLHFWPDTGLIELYDSLMGGISTSNTFGSYCLTGLINEDMPLIRYLNGDIGPLPHWGKTCGCGRTLPVLGSIQGRSNDLILTSDGRELYILDSLYNGLSIAEAQLIQLDLDHFAVNAVPGEGYDKTMVTNAIHSRLAQYLGSVHVRYNEVNDIERDANGKFRAFISKVNPIAE